MFLRSIKLKHTNSITRKKRLKMPNSPNRLYLLWHQKNYPVFHQNLSRLLMINIMKIQDLMINKIKWISIISHLITQPLIQRKTMESKQPTILTLMNSISTNKNFTLYQRVHMSTVTLLKKVTIHLLINIKEKIMNKICIK